MERGWERWEARADQRSDNIDRQLSESRCVFKISREICFRITLRAIEVDVDVEQGLS